MPWSAGEGRRVVLVGGEAGSGKSRLVREFGTAAARAGALVLYGACDAVVPAPYGPFVDALDHLTRVLDPAELRTALGTTGGELARLLPDLAERAGAPAAPAGADPDTERHRLHTAVTDLLAAVSRRRPVVLVLEDGHWADAPTLGLLRHLARAGGRVRMLLLATFRDTEADVPEPLSETLADLRRSDDVVRMRLGGAVRRRRDRVRPPRGGRRRGRRHPRAGRRAERPHGGQRVPRLRAVARARRQRRRRGRRRHAAAHPPAVRARDAGERPRGRRPPARPPAAGDERPAGARRGRRRGVRARPAAAAAATTRRCSARSTRRCAAASSRSSRRRRLAYRFTHELVRRALYDGLTGVRRAELHLRVGEALERSGDRSGRRLADLAHHFAAAAPLGGSARGAEYNLLAAHAAAATLAYGDAAERLRTALELGAQAPPERAGLLLELGDALHRAGRAVDALDRVRGGGRDRRRDRRRRAARARRRRLRGRPAGAR